MKKILLMALAAATMVGCSQNEEVENAAKKAEINFGTVVKVGTKAVVTTTDNLETFTTSGYKTEAKMAIGTALTSANALKENLKVDKIGDVWTFTGPLYWPATGYVQFFATSPAQTLTLQETDYPTITSYTVGAIDTQVDLIAANTIDQTKTTSEVIFAFQHLLTQVNFSIKGDLVGCTYEVTKLELEGVKNKATFTFNGTSNVGSWSTPEATTGSYVWTGNVTLTPTSVDDSKAIEASGALFMLMPQSLSGATLKITYSATPTGVSEATFSGEKSIALTETWGKGKNIRYTLKLSSDATSVEFGKPSVGPWVDEDSQPEVTPAK